MPARPVRRALEMTKQANRHFDMKCKALIEKSQPPIDFSHSFEMT